jgi:hypothetical protein
MQSRGGTAWEEGIVEQRGREREKGGKKDRDG